MSGTLPVVVTAAGLQPIPPQTLNGMIIALAATFSPGLTANLPGLLIDDVADAPAPTRDDRAPAWT